MRRLRRPAARWILAALLGLLVAVFYAVYYSTDVALQHAEAFNFRRMTVARLDDQHTYRFFYATNRVLQDGAGPLWERFGASSGGQLALGHFDTTIQPTVGVGMLINPTAWFQNEEIQLQGAAELPDDAFTAQLRQLSGQSPRHSLLIVVHGFKEEFETALRKTAFLGHVLDINTPVLLFDWPGNQGNSPLGYRRAREVAIASGAQLAELLDLVVREVEPARLWLVANSMGAQVVLHALELLDQRREWSDAQREFEHVVLTAPDVSREKFDRRFKPRIEALTHALTVYVSSNDRALVMSKLVNRSSRLGESYLNPSQLEEAAGVVDLTGTDDGVITLVDVTPVNRTRNFHNFSLETPEFFDDLYLRLINDDPAESRLRYRVLLPDGKVYWVLTRGR